MMLGDGKLALKFADDAPIAFAKNDYVTNRTYAAYGLPLAASLILALALASVDRFLIAGFMDEAGNDIDPDYVKTPQQGAAPATLLAASCSAPFVGTAIGFALARGPLDIVMVFAALGLGMAAPFLAVAAWPGVVTWLPRPGAWMDWLRRGLGLALLGTAAWLLSVLATEAGLWPAMMAGLALLALGAPDLLGLSAIATAWLLIRSGNMQTALQIY